MCAKAEFLDSAIEPSFRPKPRLSVAIPAYDNPDSLLRAIESVGNQTYENLEVLISDDAGPNSLEPYVRRAQDMYPKLAIRYRRQEANLGVARNKAWLFSQVTGKYCAFLEHDDAWIEPAFLATAVNALEEHHDLEIVAGNSLVEIPSSQDPQPMYRNTNPRVVLDSAWKEFPGTEISVAMLKPITASRILRGRLNHLNFSWSALVFRTETVRRAGELIPETLLSDQLARQMSVYANEESFMFLHRILAEGNALVTGSAVAFRGRPPSSFSISPSHPGRDCLNDVEVFNLVGVAQRIGSANPVVRKALIRRARSVGLRHVPPPVTDHLKTRDFGLREIAIARFNWHFHQRIAQGRTTVRNLVRPLLPR